MSEGTREKKRPQKRVRLNIRNMMELRIDRWAATWMLGKSRSQKTSGLFLFDTEGKPQGHMFSVRNQR